MLPVMDASAALQALDESTLPARAVALQTQIDAATAVAVTEATAPIHRRLHAAQRSRDKALADLTAAQQSLATQAADLATAKAALAAVQATLADAEAEVVTVTGERDQARADTAALGSALTTRTAERDQARASLATAATNLATRTVELATRTTERDQARADLAVAYARIEELEGQIPPDPTPVRFAGDPGPGRIYLGASMEGGDPGGLETQIGATIAVFRSYFKGTHSVDSMVRRAQTDKAAGRTPLLSTKLPNNNSITDFLAGRDDKWLHDRLSALDALGVPVFFCNNHEPNDWGTPAQFGQVQQRTRQMVDQYDWITLVEILNGWEFKKPNANPDVWRHDNGGHIVGFDGYNQWAPGDKDSDFKPASDVLDPGRIITTEWGLPTLIGETGVRADPKNPGKAAAWLQDAYEFALAHDFVALSYFNSGQNSPEGPWTLDGERLAKFRELIVRPEVYKWQQARRG